MTPERWQKVEQLFQQALKLAPGGRASFLAQATGGDDEIRHAVEMLLAQSSPHTSPTPFVPDAALSTILPEGSRLGPYEIEGLLGSGGMGKVYRAVDTRLGRPVAIKISAEIPGANFKREARAISALNHPHICTLYDVGPNYLVMELVEGESLAQRLDRGSLPINEVLRFGVEIAEALSAAHARGITHRDLKPGNIMLTATGIKVLDFGLAKIAIQNGSVPSFSTTTESILQPGTIQGTLAYMAPEQLEGAECDARSDLFSLGLILYEMATGRRAFAAASQATLIGDILHRTPDLSVLQPPGLKAIVEKSLAKKPEDRWQSAEEVRQALQMVEKVPTASLAEMRGAVRRSTRRIWTKGMAVAAIVLLVATMAAALWLRVRQPHASGPLTVSPLGDYAGMVQQPSLSPDGSHIAFSWNGVDPQNFDIYVKSIASNGPLKGAPLRLTTDPADDFAPAWSPDGSSVAFLRQVNGGSHYLVLLVPALGGLERRLAEIALPDISQLSGPYLAWVDDGRSLVVENTTRSGVSALHVLSIDSGALRQVTFPPDGNIGDHCVSASPDGTHLLFRRATLRPEWSGKLYRLAMNEGASSSNHVVPVAMPVNQCAAWTADGKSIVYPSGLGMWTLPIEGGAAPKLLVETGRGGNWPSVAPRGSRMAYTRTVGGNLEIRRLNLSSSGEIGGASARFASSSRDQFAPMFSPDGSKVAFSSGRAEVSEIWVCNRDGAGCNQLTWTDNANTGDPSWSPDGKSIAYYSTLGGHARIYTTVAEGGDAQAVTSADIDSIYPSWSRDGKWIYFTSRQTGAYQVWKVAPQGGRAVQVTQQGGYAPVESPDGHWLYYLGSGDKEAALWRMRLPAGKPELLLPSVLFHNFAVAARGIYFIARSGDGPAIQFLDISSRQSRVIAPVHSGYAGLTVSPDAKTILYTETATATSQIYVIDNLH
jgi:Tol biopolymer transport system component/predicted Ser/Thr protein kinase